MCTVAKLRKMPQMIYLFSIKEVFHLQKSFKFLFQLVKIFFKKPMWLILIFALKKMRKTTSKMSTENKIKRITVKKIYPPVANIMLSSVFQENSATFSPAECVNCIPIIGCNNMDIILSQTQWLWFYQALVKNFWYSWINFFLWNVNHFCFV